jgi:divalent metal cation (Fe/Co/Zn/Cd) transporter
MRLRTVAEAEPGVRFIEKCRVRKSGLALLTDIHVVVDGSISVREGHEIAHRVKDRLMASELSVRDVVVHIEPDRR